MKKEVIFVLAILILITACVNVKLEKTSSKDQSSLTPNKEKDLARGLDLSSSELQTLSEKFRNQDAVWFNKLSAPEIKLTIKKGNQFSPEQSEKVCNNMCNACSQRLGKDLADVKFQTETIQDDTCACNFGEDLDGSQVFSCLDEANRVLFSESFDSKIIQNDPSKFPKLNQMYFMFTNYDKSKLDKKFCDNVCGYCSTKFNLDLDFASSAIDEEGALKCTCQTTDTYGVNYYRLNSCLADLVNIFPSK